MGTAIINIRTDAKVKSQAQKIAADLGISLSALINGFIRHLIRTKRVEFDLVEERPNEYMIKALKESEEDYRKGDYHSFAKTSDALAFLDKMIEE
jgi:addiction module RelB/DinJ family antitoxin